MKKLTTIVIIIAFIISFLMRLNPSQYGLPNLGDKTSHIQSEGVTIIIEQVDGKTYRTIYDYDGMEIGFELID